VPIQRINLLVNDRRAVTAETAILLAKALGTTPEFWMNLQTQCDLWTSGMRNAV
jgi:addiction module HigA family antidote